MSLCTVSKTLFKPGCVGRPMNFCQICLFLRYSSKNSGNGSSDIEFANQFRLVPAWFV